MKNQWKNYSIEIIEIVLLKFYFFFCERHKTYLSGSDGNTYYFFNMVKTRNEVLNTITNNV